MANNNTVGNLVVDVYLWSLVTPRVLGVLVFTCGFLVSLVVVVAVVLLICPVPPRARPLTGLVCAVVVVGLIDRSLSNQSPQIVSWRQFFCPTTSDFFFLMYLQPTANLGLGTLFIGVNLVDSNFHCIFASTSVTYRSERAK